MESNDPRRVSYGRPIVAATYGEICVTLSGEGYAIEYSDAQSLLRPALIAAYNKIGAGKRGGRFLYNRADAMKLARQVLRDAGYGPGSMRAAGWTRYDMHFAPTDHTA
jgi:hypothetical protein